MPYQDYRILHRTDGFYVVQIEGYADGLSSLPFGWHDRKHSRKENVFLWETKELAAAYLCGISISWIEPIRMHEAMTMVVEETAIEAALRNGH